MRQYIFSRYEFRNIGTGLDLGAVQPDSSPRRQDITGIIGNNVLVNSGFHLRKDFSAFSKVLPELSYSKKHKNIVFKVKQVLSLTGTPNTCLGPALLE
jgi:hypothetical protein